MKQRLIIIVSLLFFIGSVLLLLLLRDANQGQVPTSNPKEGAPHVGGVNKAPSATTMTGPPPVTAEDVERFRKQGEEKQRELQKIFNTPIDFYGIVLDENSRPVYGASVTYSILSKYEFKNPPPEIGPQSESDGRFSIVGRKGASIFVKVEHPDYHSTADSKHTFEFYQSPALKQKQSLPTSSSPAVFRLVNRGQAEPLVHVRSGSISIPKDGTPVEVSLRRKGAPRIQNGDLRVECWTEDSSSSQPGFHPFAWKCRITIPGGGLVERQERFAFVAPEGGYRTSDEIDMSQHSDRSRWRDHVERDYFVRLPDGSYTRLTFSMIAGGSHYFVIDSYLNPTPGSRNLEFDKAKEVKVGRKQ